MTSLNKVLEIITRSIEPFVCVVSDVYLHYRIEFITIIPTHKIIVIHVFYPKLTGTNVKSNFWVSAQYFTPN